MSDVPVMHTAICRIVQYGYSEGTLQTKHLQLKLMMSATSKLPKILPNHYIDSSLLAFTYLKLVNGFKWICAVG